MNPLEKLRAAVAVLDAIAPLGEDGHYEDAQQIGVACSHDGKVSLETRTDMIPLAFADDDGILTLGDLRAIVAMFPA